MATANVNILGNHSACAIRAVRLGADCVPLSGAKNGVVAAGLMTGTNTPEMETGTRFEPKDACGKFSYVDEDPDVTKRRTLSLEFNLFDFEAIELLTDSTLILGKTGGPFAAKNVGVNMPGIGTTIKYPIGLEIWVKNARGAGPCSADGTVPLYTRHLFPRVKLYVGDYSYDNAVHTLKLTGWSTPNAAYSDFWGDWTGITGIDPGSPWAWAYDTVLPAVGDAATGGGYITVPTPT